MSEPRTQYRIWVTLEKLLPDGEYKPVWQPEPAGKFTDPLIAMQYLRTLVEPGFRDLIDSYLSHQGIHCDDDRHELAGPEPHQEGGHQAR